MAEIKKIKVDGVEYDIGSNLGAELEWKLVEVVEYEYAEDDEGVNLTFHLSRPLEKGKTYKIIYVAAGATDDAYTSILDYANETGEDCYCATPCVYRSYDSDAGALGMLTYESNSNSLSILQLNRDDNQYAAGTKLYIYELAIKNVENPSNVVTPNKLKLYTTGTYYNEGSAYPQATYLLDKNLEPNKMYYIERYDYNMESLFSCFMTTYYDEDTEEVETKGICSIKVFESDGDTLIDAIIKLEGGTSEKRHLKIITAGDISFYHSGDDYIKIYELPFEF